MTKDAFIYRGDPTLYIKRGCQVLKSVSRNPDSFGLVGSDRVNEDGFMGTQELIGPVVNKAGQQLRFGLIATRKRSLAGELPIVTSYPDTARRVLGELGLNISSIQYVPGCVETEVGEYDLVGFELVQSGDSVDKNQLLLLEDDLERVDLLKVATSNITPTLAS